MLLLETNTNLHSSCSSSNTSSPNSSSPRSTTKKSSGNTTVMGSVRKTTKKPARVDPRLVVTSSTRLRSNLLRKLGIPPSSAHHYKDGSVTSAQGRRVSLLANVKVERVPLKPSSTAMSDSNTASTTRPCRVGGTDTVFQALGSLWTRQQLQQQPEASSSLGSTSTTSTTMSMDDDRRHVHFDPNVQVAMIPTRHEYSNRIRRFLWDTPATMQEHIIRNTLEFTADGWDWHTCLEEEEHFYNPRTQEYIHPIHLELAEMPPEEQEILVPANYINPALVQQQQVQQQQCNEDPTITAPPVLVTPQE